MHLYQNLQTGVIQMKALRLICGAFVILPFSVMQGIMEMACMSGKEIVGSGIIWDSLGYETLRINIYADCWDFNL